MRRALLFACLVLCVMADLSAGEKPLRHIAFGSCVHQEDAQPIWDSILATKPDLFLFIGDNIYHDVHRTKEAKEWTIRQKYQKQLDVPGYKKLRAACPVLGTWDDHDYGLNDAGEEYPHKKDSQEAFLDFFGVPADSPRRKQEGVYHAQVFGPPEQSVQVILLDTRYFRGPLLKRSVPPGTGPYIPNPDKKATLLGEAQWKWLEEQLKVPAKVRILASSIQVVPEDHGWEKWMNLPHERERLFNLLKETRASGVVIISGDRHLAELSMMDAGIGYPLYDLTSSGLNQAFKNWRPQEVNKHRVATMNFGHNSGLITIDWDGKDAKGKPDPILTLQIRDEEGEITIRQKVPLSVLQPGKIKAKTVFPDAKAAINGKPITPELLKDLKGQEVKLVMTVQATGATKKGDRVFLNSAADRGPENFVVVLEGKALSAFKSQAEAQKAYQGKTIQVSGMISTFREQAQIIVSDPKQISVEGD